MYTCNLGLVDGLVGCFLNKIKRFFFYVSLFKLGRFKCWICTPMSTWAAYDKSIAGSKSNYQQSNHYGVSISKYTNMQNT